MNRLRFIRPLFYSALVIFLLLIPLLVKKDYYLHMLIMMGVNAILGLSVRLMMRAGLISLGHAAFVAVGAYTCALVLTRLHMSFWFSLPLALVASGIVGWGMAVLTLRIKGVYFILLTLAFAEALRIFLSMWKGVTGGAIGIVNIPAPSIRIPGLFVVEFASKTTFYYLMLVLVFLTVTFFYRVRRAKFGFILDSVRQSDMLSESAGIPVSRYKTVAFIISCAFAGLAGAFLAPFIRVVSPGDFTILYSVNILMYAALGGMDFAGPIVAACILTALSELLRGSREYQPAVFGIILIIIMLFLPGGLTELRSRLPGMHAKFRYWR